MADKLKAGIIGATGMVGQRFAVLLAEHPWFEVTTVAASKRSAGKTYREALDGRWVMPVDVPENLSDLKVLEGAAVDDIANSVDLVFCAVDMPKTEIYALEEAFAKSETPVISNNSAHRNTKDVPMTIPEINHSHSKLIDYQRKRLGTKSGFIAVKPNCSIQSYVPALHPLQGYGIKKVAVTTYQAISGSGKTFDTFPEIADNIIPFIPGEEEKSEREPLRIWGELKDGEVVPASSPVITSQCVRVPVSDGHLAAVFVEFETKPAASDILGIWDGYRSEPWIRELPSAPERFLYYLEDPDRPQTRLDRDYENGMGVTIGRLREDQIFDYRFICLSHNTLRGAAGGGVLSAEMLVSRGYITAK
jgi:aspartate-semialdehyde dehydrogenase